MIGPVAQADSLQMLLGQTAGRASPSARQQERQLDVSRHRLPWEQAVILEDDGPAQAGALVQDPELLLMDEPFSSLDALTREAMQDSLLELHSRRGPTVLIVTHSIEEAAYLADRVYVMRGRNPGRIAAAIEAPAGRVRGEAFRAAPAFLEYTNGIRGALEGCPSKGGI
jgi:ABC-type taurine transport system ATPase subunit